MHYEDVIDDCGVWRGLELQVERRHTAFRAELASGRRLRLSCDGAPVLWARAHPYYLGTAWALTTQPVEGLVRPIRAADVRAVGTNDLSAWARYFARELDESPRSPLHEGTWRLEEVWPEGTAPADRAYDWRHVGGVSDYLTQDRDGYEDWESGNLIGLRPRCPGDAARVKAWRKRARDGSLPPVLLGFVSPLDMFVVYDGHDRLAAALDEGTTPPMLCLWYTRRYDRETRPDFQEGVARRYREGLARPDRALTVEHLNALTIEAWDDRPVVVPTTRGWAIPGGGAVWDEEVNSRIRRLAVAPSVERYLADCWDEEHTAAMRAEG